MEKPEEVKRQLDETTQLLKNNTNKLVERDSHLDDIESRSAQLLLNSNTFRREARTLRRKQCISSYSCIMIGFSIFIILIVIIIVSTNKVH
jgi:hypothetical protein